LNLIEKRFWNQSLATYKYPFYRPPVMPLWRTIITFLCALSFYLPLKAEPVNVLVGDLTFTRPEAWTWESPGSAAKSNVLTRFIIPNDSGKPTTDVRFYIAQKNAREAAALWKSYFPQAKPKEDIREEQKTINGHELTYVSLTGTQSFPGSKPRPNCTFFGAIIPSGKDYVHIRLFGPKEEVERATTQFKKMVEDALKEAE
jgi:hypothetical protein